MREAGSELEEVVVLAPKVKGSVSALVEVRRQSSAVADVLGAEQMARSGDSDAASSLRRVTGLTLVNGKFVYVRGLGERYSSVQMNSFSLPSPEPSRRVVPLDLFPTSALESVLVQKSYSPDLPGEFGGGVIQLQTRTLPDKFYFRASLSTNYEPSGGLMSYRGGSIDAFGIDDGGREMPGAIREALSSGRKLVPKQTGSPDGIDEAELTSLSRSLNNNYNVSGEGDSAPMPGLSLATGDRFRMGTASLGVSGSLLYGSDLDSGERQARGFNVGAGGRLDPDYSRTSAYSESEVRLAGNLDLGLELNKNHQLGFSTYVLRHTSDLVQVDSKRDANSPSVAETTTIEWTERQLWTKHFKGRHLMKETFPRQLEFNWRAGWSDAERAQPDRREYTYDRTGGSSQMRGGSDGNRRTWSDLSDDSNEVGADIAVSLLPESEKLKLKFGAVRQGRLRRSDVSRLFFISDSAGGVEGVEGSASPEEHFDLDNRGPGKYQLRNITDAADSYSGAQTVDAQYAMLDYVPVKSWSFQAGARHERSVQAVKTFRYYAPENPFSRSELIMDDVLPAYSATWRPDDRWRARLAYSETLARPDFRELSEVGFIDDETGYQVEGDSSLKGTVIRNVDHRWEYYFTSDEYVSLGGFYKNFLDPIEVMFKPGVNNIQTFANAKSATNYGLEFETRFGLRNASRVLRRWSLLSNLTWIQSRIELDERNRGIQTSDSRPLQGQSPYVVNLQFQYDRPLWGFSGTLLYNVVGPRITEVGTNERPDIYEQPFHQLDFVLSQKIDKNWSAGFRAKNLLDPVVEAKQGGEVVRSLRRGRTFALGLSAAF
ncbi:MAG: TonB-dependent receptor [Calothrix sp. SM1_5_4]|nr:TonB-dependent receptor [Calothrix sp. SM1_5_4]